MSEEESDLIYDDDETNGSFDVESTSIMMR